MTLRTRLMLMLMLAVSVGALVFGVVARVAVERILYDGIDRELAVQIDRLQRQTGREGASVMEMAPPRRFGGRDRDDDDDRPIVFGRDALIAQVLDPSGTPVTSTGGVAAIGGLPEPESDLDPRGRASTRTVEIDDDRYRLAEARTRSGGTVQVARPLSEVDDFLATLAWVLVAATLVAAGAAIALARWAAGATLRPVQSMTSTADQIRETRDLSQRVAPAYPDPEIAELASAVNGMLHSLETANATQRQFVADASHELRTPLTSLTGNASYLHRSTELSDDQREVVAAIERDADRLARITDSLTTLARLDAAAPVQLEPVDIDDLVSTIVGRATKRFAAHRFEIRGRAGMWVVDAELSERIIGNLVMNAGAYTPDGSTVVVTSAAQEHRLLLTIEDNGPGLSKQQLASYRQRFKRGSHATQESGSGLGFAIVEEAVAQLGGSITFDHVAPHGLRCIVELPRSSG